MMIDIDGDLHLAMMTVMLVLITGNKGGGNPEDSTVETLFYSRHWFVSTNISP